MSVLYIKLQCKTAFEERISFFKKIILINLFFLVVLGLQCRHSLVVASGNKERLFTGSCRLLLWSTGSRRAGFRSCGTWLSCSEIHVIFLDQGSNLCHLHWQLDSYPLCHQESQDFVFYKMLKTSHGCPVRCRMSLKLAVSYL